MLKLLFDILFQLYILTVICSFAFLALHMYKFKTDGEYNYKVMHLLLNIPPSDNNYKALLTPFIPIANICIILLIWFIMFASTDTIKKVIEEMTKEVESEIEES